MIDQKDRPLFEALCGAIVGGLCADPGFNQFDAKWDKCATGPAAELVAAIRAAEGPEEVASAREDWLQVEAVLQSRLDQSEAIIHALCDDRAAGRLASRQVVRALLTCEADQYAECATDEDELTLSDLVGRTVTKIEGMEVGSYAVKLRTSDGLVWKLEHSQDCCEDVSLIDIEGDPADLIGLPLSMAEESTREATEEELQRESGTWTFYRFAARGHVTLRWLGTSNGYYSERVDLTVEVAQ